MKVWYSVVYPFVSVFVFLAVLAQPARADRMALWNIVNLKCVRHFEKAEAPVPCEAIDITGGEDRGFVYLKDLNGVAQMLTIPIRRLTGIEDPALLEADAPNYFAGAWIAKAFVERRLHRSLPRDALGITVNSMLTRSQDQLHFHVDCLDKDVAATLDSQASALDDHWRPMTVELKGRRYWARRLDSADLSGADPFRLLADGIDGAKAEMGVWSLAAVGADFAGQPGFILLADRTESGSGGHAEDLQDHDCLITGPKS
jgi:CDP-diacylglycerol pyrophosphatase